MADQERKGDDFVAQADKKLKGWAFFGGKYDDAAELLEKAGTAYKVAKACTHLVHAAMALFSAPYTSPSSRMPRAFSRETCADATGLAAS